jgi:hypothetical protein
MERLTKASESKNVYIVDDSKIEHLESGYTGYSINKLAQFENMYDDLKAKQVEIAKELEKLRSEGKTHTVKFKQLLTNKMTNSNIISLFEVYGL